MTRVGALLSGYLAVSRLPGASRTLDCRITLLASQLAAELSGCRWCIERGRHDWRRAGLSPDLLSELGQYFGSRFFSEREQAALAFVQMTQSGTGMSVEHETVLLRARQFFRESELAELTAISAERHCPGAPFTFNQNES